MKRLTALLIGCAAIGFTADAKADLKCKPNGNPFFPNYCAVRQCPNGQWSVGSANLLSTGTVVVTQVLATDRVDYGIKGWVEFSIKDKSGNTIAYGYTQERSIPAKVPGKVRLVEFQPDEKKVSEDILRRASTIEVSSKCGGDTFEPFGIKLDPSKITELVVKEGAPQK